MNALSSGRGRARIALGAVSLLVYDSWQRTKHKFALYYFEVMTGEQTQNFHPTDYVDITATEAVKRRACFAHKSQGPEEFYAWHEKMSRFRGRSASAAPCSRS